MAGAAQSGNSVGWALFSLRGRLGRKGFWLAALLVIFAQAAVISQALQVPDTSPAYAWWGLAFLATLAVSAWIGLALAVKRLHDLNLPAILAICLVIPAISLIAFLLLALLPPYPNENAHGSPPL